jgi:MFS transporter, PPP family, 3-phenylpropionic acid transporter
MQSDRNRGTLAAQYFLYFGIMGAYLPFFNLYCYSLAFTGWQIGALSALRSIVLILFSILWSVASDRYRARRTIYLICNFFSAALWGLFLMTTDFSWMMVITVFYGVFYSPLISFLETFSMEALGKNKKQYGRMRAWGSVAFITMVMVLGRFIESHTVTIILGVILVTSWVQALLALRLPRMAESPHQSPADHSWNALVNGKVIVFLSSAFLMLASHGAYYAFFSIHLSNLGFDGLFIGLCWAVAVMSEIVVMFMSERIFRRFSYEAVLIFSFALATLRWIGLWYVTAPAGLIFMQITHAASYGTFHMASILYMDTLTPEKAKTIGQAANNAVTYGLGLMVGFFLSGALYSVLGSPALFALSGGISLAGGILFAVYVMVQGRRSMVNRPN